MRELELSLDTHRHCKFRCPVSNGILTPVHTTHVLHTHRYNRGALLSALVFIYALTAGISGYVSGVHYKMFGGNDWVNNVLLVRACLCVCVCLC